VVAELELVGASSEGQTRELVAQADAEDGHAPQKFADRSYSVINRLGVAGTVG
jgi:hypothetical protein